MSSDWRTIENDVLISEKDQTAIVIAYLSKDGKQCSMSITYSEPYFVIGEYNFHLYCGEIEFVSLNDSIKQRIYGSPIGVLLDDRITDKIIEHTELIKPFYINGFNFSSITTKEAMEEAKRMYNEFN